MGKNMYYRDLPLEFRLKFIKDVFLENYPFTKDDLEDFHDKLDFMKLSANQFIDWDVELLQKYENRWDWFAIENNPIIRKEVNLGMLYPNKVHISKPKCECFKMLDFCTEQKHCTGIYDEVMMNVKSKSSVNPNLFGFIKFLYEDYSFGPFLINIVFQYNLLIDTFDDYELDIPDVKENYDKEDIPF